jgi:hypothetical protein
VNGRAAQASWPRRPIRLALACVARRVLADDGSSRRLAVGRVAVCVGRYAAAVIEPSPLPGDPTELHLRISYDDDLWGTPQADTLERWNVAVLHRRRTHDDGQDLVPSSGCVTTDCPTCTVEDVAVGEMTFYRIHLDRGRNAYWAMEEESEELYETAQVLLDPLTGSFTSEAGELLEYVGSALLVMDRVTLDPQWRGRGLAAVLAIEAIHRLMPGCRAIACSPGITDLGSQRLMDR